VLEKWLLEISLLRTHKYYASPWNWAFLSKPLSECFRIIANHVRSPSSGMSNHIAGYVVPMFRRKVSPLSSRVLRRLWTPKNEGDTCLQKVGNHLSTDAVALPSGRGSSVVVVVVVLVWLFHLIFICITYFGLIGFIKKGLFYNWIPAL